MNSIKDTYEKIKSRTMELKFDRMYEYEWDWTNGVALYGLMKCWKYCKDRECYDFVKNWVDRHVDEKFDVMAINSVIVLDAFVSIYQTTKDEKYLNLCEKYADWLLTEAPRLQCGAWEHTVRQDVTLKGQAWIDTTFMAAVFLAEYSQTVGSKRYLDEAVKQLFLHHKLLKDEATGLYFHGYDENTGGHHAAGLWGRGNGWMAVSTAEILICCDSKSDHYESLLHSFAGHIAALANYQDESGMWHTVIDRKESYLEMSATILCAYAIYLGIDAGLLDKKYLYAADKAFDALLLNTDASGKVGLVSDGTGIAERTEQYMTCPYGGLYAWGQGPALAVLARKLEGSY